MFTFDNLNKFVDRKRAPFLSCPCSHIAMRHCERYSQGPFLLLEPRERPGFRFGVPTVCHFYSASSFSLWHLIFFSEVVCLLVACLTSQQHASVSQGRIYLDNCTCCHTEIQVADQTFYLTQSQYTDAGPTRRLTG